MPLDPKVRDARILVTLAELKLMAAQQFARHAEPECLPPSAPAPSVALDRNLPPPRRSRSGGDGRS